MLSRFTVENYRAFARAQSIEVRPLTLFFGWNSGGKSALLRFLPLLVESIREAGPAIWLKGEVGKNATWPELVCKATRRPSFKFGLYWESMGPFSAEWDIDGDLGGKWQENRSVRLKKNDTEHLFSPDNQPASQWQGYPPDRLIDFVLPSEASRLALDLRHLVTALLENVQWIGGVRGSPPRLATFSGGNPPPLKPNGGNVFDHIIAAQVRSSNDPMLQVIGAFFAALDEQLVLDNPFENNWRIMLHPTHAPPEVRVNLCDTGEGYSQVLPVLVALARARHDGPRLLCLEQPELHLHTRAQAQLAKVLVDTVKSARQPRILVETHSEVLLTSIQLAIANGDIPPEDVRVYWVESGANGTSDAVAVDFDAFGRPNNSMLAVAFDEALDLGQKLLAKQMARNKKAS